MNLFITFEGIEGSGKTTQIRLLKKALQKRDYETVTTREPGGTAISDQIRRVLLNRNNKRMVPLCELFLYEASRAQHVAEVIRPSLKQKKIVISDRFSDATTVYQGMARGFPPRLVSKLNAIATQNLKPDLTIVLDCPIHRGLGRLRKQTRHLDRIEREKAAFHQKIRAGYLGLAHGQACSRQTCSRQTKRVKVIDGNRPPKVVHEEILKMVLKRLNRRPL